MSNSEMPEKINRLDYYYDYYRNLSPNSFSVVKKGDSIIISDIEKKSGSIAELLRAAILKNPTITG
jgi:hypothetical protein